MTQIKGSIEVSGPGGQPVTVPYSGSYRQIKSNLHSTQDQFEYEVAVSWNPPHDAIGILTTPPVAPEDLDAVLKNSIEVAVRKGLKDQFGTT
jgi:hypothetical protein